MYIRHKASRFRTNRALLRVDLDSPHSCKIDHHTTVTHSESSGAMASTSHRQRQVVVSSKFESSCNVVGNGAAHDHRRMPIVGVIMDLACQLIFRSVRRNDVVRQSSTPASGLNRRRPRPISSFPVGGSSVPQNDRTNTRKQHSPRRSPSERIVFL